MVTWRMKSFGMLHCVVGYVDPDVSNYHSVIFRVKRSSCTAWPWRWRHYDPSEHLSSTASLEGCENLKSRTVTCLGKDPQTTAATQLTFTWRDYPGAWKSPRGLSSKSSITDVRQISCYMHWQTDWLTDCMEQSPSWKGISICYLVVGDI